MYLLYLDVGCLDFRERGGGWLVGGGFARRAHMIRARHVN